MLQRDEFGRPVVAKGRGGLVTLQDLGNLGELISAVAVVVVCQNSAERKARDSEYTFYVLRRRSVASAAGQVRSSQSGAS